MYLLTAVLSVSVSVDFQWNLSIPGSYHSGTSLFRATIRVEPLYSGQLSQWNLSILGNYHSGTSLFRATNNSGTSLFRATITVEPLYSRQLSQWNLSIPGNYHSGTSLFRDPGHLDIFFDSSTGILHIPAHHVALLLLNAPCRLHCQLRTHRILLRTTHTSTSCRVATVECTMQTTLPTKNTPYLVTIVDYTQVESATASEITHWMIHAKDYIPKLRNREVVDIHWNIWRTLVLKVLRMDLLYTS